MQSTYLLSIKALEEWIDLINVFSVGVKEDKLHPMCDIVINYLDTISHTNDGLVSNISGKKV